MILLPRRGENSRSAAECLNAMSLDTVSIKECTECVWVLHSTSLRRSIPWSGLWYFFVAGLSLIYFCHTLTRTHTCDLHECIAFSLLPTLQFVIYQIEMLNAYALATHRIWKGSMRRMLQPSFLVDLFVFFVAFSSLSNDLQSIDELAMYFYPDSTFTKIKSNFQSTIQPVIRKSMHAFYTPFCNKVKFVDHNPRKKK